MRYIPFKVLKLLAVILHAFYSLIYPKYSKHGQRKITIPQKLTLITIARAFGFVYRDIPLIAEDLRDVLKLKHITTFQNFNDFANRIRPQEIQDAIEFSAAIIIKLNNAKERIILIDSTGFQIMDASSYYNYRAQKAADFFKLHVVMDLATKAIILATPSDRYYHDLNPLKLYFIDELAKLARELGFKIKVISADSAYSSSEIYKRIKEEIKAIPAIKPSKGRGSPRMVSKHYSGKSGSCPGSDITLISAGFLRRCLRSLNASSAGLFEENHKNQEPERFCLRRSLGI